MEDIDLVRRLGRRRIFPLHTKAVTSAVRLSVMVTHLGHCATYCVRCCFPAGCRIIISLGFMGRALICDPTACNSLPFPTLSTHQLVGELYLWVHRVGEILNPVIVESVLVLASKKSQPRLTLVVMAKAPRAGAVKSRLAKDIGAARAVSFYRSVSRNVLGRLGRDPRFETVLSVAPDWAVGEGLWPAHITKTGQGRGNLGVRMQRIMNWRVRGPIIIVGTDIPGIMPRHIVDAFRLLGRHDAVFGSAGDGGYWLVGLRRRPKVLDIFKDVRWSTELRLRTRWRTLRGCRSGMRQNWPMWMTGRIIASSTLRRVTQDRGWRGIDFLRTMCFQQAKP